MASGIKGSSKPSGGTPTYATTALVTATATTTLILSVCNQTASDDVKNVIFNVFNAAPFVFDVFNGRGN